MAREFLKMAKLADLATTPSTILAERYAAAGIENVAVIANHLPRWMPGFGSKPTHAGTVIGWMALCDRYSLTSMMVSARHVT